MCDRTKAIHLGLEDPFGMIERLRDAEEPHPL
jgi:hypothetical protein